MANPMVISFWSWGPKNEGCMASNKKGHLLTWKLLKLKQCVTQFFRSKFDGKFSLGIFWAGGPQSRGRRAHSPQQELEGNSSFIYLQNFPLSYHIGTKYFFYHINNLSAIFFYFFYIGNVSGYKIGNFLRYIILIGITFI